jgi:Xaa-Pro dipeptidase
MRFLHFDESEYAERRQRAIAAAQENSLDALLIFTQESMFYLTGYDTTGYVKFQGMVLTSDGVPHLLTRSADLRQSALTSVIEDIRIWVDREGADPGKDLQDVLADLRLAGNRIGVETDAYGLTGKRWDMVRRHLDGFCSYEDCSAMLSHLRLVKSPTEMACVKRAAELADIGLAAAEAVIAPGVPENEVFAEMHGAQFRAGGDYTASRFIIGSGPRALMVRNFSGYGVIGNDDQVQLEFSGVSHHYHACLMRTVLTGTPNPRHLEMHKVGLEALQACREEVRPGRTFGDVFEAHARVFDTAGYQKHRLNACGYTLGAQYPPCWMGTDEPMIYAGNPMEFKTDMVIFLHMILMDSDAGLTMCPGETVRVSADGCERLSKASLDLVIKR